MPAGFLRDRATIQQRAQTQDDYGGVVDSWVDVATVWAGVAPLKGREFFAGAQAQSEVTMKVTVRGGVAVKPSMRVVVAGRTLQVEAVLADTKGAHSVLMCKEVQQ